MLLAIPTLVVISVCVFVFVRILPGDPAIAMAGMNATEQQVKAIGEKLGLNEPIYVQYYIWLKDLLTGHLGNSIKNQYPIAQLLRNKLPVTLVLTGGGMSLAIALALPIGLAAGAARSGIVRNLCTVWLGIMYAIPTFWLGIMLVIMFSMSCHCLPPNGYVAFSLDVGKGCVFFVLPWLTIAVKQSSVIGRYVQASYLEEAGKDYVSVARAKGIKESRVRMRHILRNALIPVITMIGLQLGGLLAGAVVTETIFNLPGLGRLMLSSLFMRDYPVLQILILFVGGGFVALNFLVDITYAIADPRITYE